MQVHLVLVTFWRYTPYGLGLIFYIGAKFYCNHCLKGIQQVYEIPYLPAASECPQEKAFPRVVFSRSVRSLFVKAKACFH